MENSTFFEYISFIVLFAIIPLQIFVLFVELLVFFLYKLFSPDKMITYRESAELTSKDIKSVKMVTYFVTFLSVFSAYSLYKYQSFLIAVPFVVSGVILYANWKLACRIYILHKHGTEKGGVKELE